MSTYRDGLPHVPWRLRHRPIERGYPVPWFVCQVDGRYDFRIVDARKFQPAVERRLCWLCGLPLQSRLAFTIGPMCVINRTISEPPSHQSCAEFALIACPFLTQQEVRRRETDLPPDARPPAGFGIMRQPGAACLWITKSYRLMRENDGRVLFRIGDPIAVSWWREGRAATRAEVLQSIESGYPILLEAAQQDGDAAVRDLEAARERAMGLLPVEDV